MADETGKKKIIIDEDWKNRVDAEREEAQQESQRQPDSEAADGPKMPPASFDMLVTTLATEAMICLGQIPHPVSGTQEVAPEQAKYFIDTLGMLQQKTAGNLTADEEKALEGLLHQLRMVFVAGQSRVTTPTSDPPSVD